MRYCYFFFRWNFFLEFFFCVCRDAAPVELVAQRRMLTRQAPPMQAMTTVLFFCPGGGALVALLHLRARQVPLLAQETAARAADAGCDYDGMRP
jgi:hypothetical protein